MNGQLTRLDVVVKAGAQNEMLGDLCILLSRKAPAHDIPAVNVHDNVEVVVGPFLLSLKFGNIPAPHLLGLHCNELWHRILPASQLISSLANLVVLTEQSIHCRDGTQVDSLAQ